MPLSSNHSHHRRRSIRLVMLSLLALLPSSFLLAVLLGAVDLPLSGTLHSLFWQIESAESQVATIVQKIRLPRALLAALVGALLAISGAAMQGLFRNPLADPSLIGVTAGASVGASLMIVLGVGASLGVGSLAGLSLVSLGALAGGALAVWLVYRLATREGVTSVATMLLAGIAITALAGSVTSLLEFYADNSTLRRISLWRMGGLDGASYQRVLLAFVVALVVIGFLLRQARALNALLLGESEARHLGIAVDALKYRLVILVAAGVGISVALAGAIGFVGLVVPHIIRLMIGPDHRYLLPASALAGAVLLLLSDTLARVVVAPTELPVGLITALIGAPFFISLLRQRRDYGL